MKAQHVEAFFATLRAANPQPTTELEYTSVFELLAAVLLSAQATDVGVNKATRKLFPVANTPQKILDLGLPALESHIKTIGLYRSKARHLMATCEILIQQHQGEVPGTREALEALPGVGRKTANVVLGVGCGKAEGIVGLGFRHLIAPAFGVFGMRGRRLQGAIEAHLVAEPSAQQVADRGLQQASRQIP